MAYRKSPNVVVFAHEQWHFIFDTQTKGCRCFDEPEKISVLDQLGSGNPFSLSNCTEDDELFLEELEREGFLTVTNEDE